MSSPKLSIARLALCVFLLPALGLAQSGANTGVAGRVTDPSQAGVPGATVTVAHTAAGLERSVETDEAGYFDARYLPVGEYTVTVKAEGFQTIAREGVRVTTDELAGANIEMELGQEATEVTVVADAEMVNRNSAAIVRELDERELERLPTSSRNSPSFC